MRALVVTRAADEGGANDARDRTLREAGIPVVHFPLIRILPPADPDAARVTLAGLAGFDLAVPVSPAAVRATFALLEGPWPEACMLGLVGPGSHAAVLRELTARGQAAGPPRVVAAPADQADSEGLWRALQAVRPQGWVGARVLILRGGTGREWLAERFDEAGAQVVRLAVYRREAPALDAPTLARLRTLLAQDAVWLLSASEAVGNMGDMLRADGHDPARILADRRAVATHARIAQAARTLGFGHVDACMPADDAIIAAVRACGQGRPGH